VVLTRATLIPSLKTGVNRLSPYHALLLLLSLPATLSHYFRRSTGESYGIGTVAKFVLAAKMVRNNIRIVSASNFVEHLVMAATILTIPRTAEGCIVECGSYKGGSAANLSLVAALCGRGLEVFDSFGGLPEPSEGDRAHTVLHRGERHTYEEGAWAGTLDEVKGAITKYGAIEVCSFHAGQFEATLPGFKKITASVFADVDLRTSVEVCLRYLWPLLPDGRYFYTHEATHMEIASLFFDRDWWHSTLHCEPPGLVGAGTGLGLVPGQGGFRSALGYCVKAPERVHLKEVPQPGLVGG